MNILKVPNRFGQMLGRMGGEYKLLQKDDDGFVIGAPASLTEMLLRKGGEFKPILDSEYVVYKATSCTNETILANFTTNQDSIVQVSQKENSATVVIDSSTLVEYDNGSGSKKWLCFIVRTNYNTIIGIKVNGKVMTEDDVREVDEFGGDAGELLAWVDSSKTTTTLTIGAKGATTETVTITLKEKA